MAVIRIKNLKIPTIIGFNPEERINIQNVVINLEIEVDISSAVNLDSEDVIYNYKTITKAIFAFVSKSKYNLLEKLTYEVLQLIMKDDRIEHHPPELPLRGKKTVVPRQLVYLSKRLPPAHQRRISPDRPAGGDQRTLCHCKDRRH